jgi:hypothetical protein
MDENPYRSPVAAGAARPGIMGLVIARVVWLGLGVLGAGSSLLGLAILATAFAYGRLNDPLAFGVGSGMLWMGAFLVLRAIKRFRRPALPMDQQIG